MQPRTSRGNSVDAPWQEWLPGEGSSAFDRPQAPVLEEVSSDSSMENRAISPGTSAANRLLIIDGHCYAYRAFFAIRSLVSPQGEPTNAIYGFIRMLAKVQSVVQPSHLVVVWDGGLAQERMTLLPQYKAQRAEMPASLESQLDQIVLYLQAANISSYMKEGCEADDYIACLTARSVQKGWTVVIASSDKDFMQLAGPQVRLLNPQDKPQTPWSAEQVKLKTGVEPAQVVDWLSLIGDSVDNIPGVPGIGPKTATALLTQFGSVEQLYRRLEEVGSERLRTNLQAAQDLVRRNQQMVRLKDDLECDEPLEAMTVKPGDAERLRRLFSGWGFKKLQADLEQTRLATFLEH
jgi:DNA polymerase I